MDRLVLFFYRHLAGIKPNGLKVIEISPGPVSKDSKLTEVEASYKSIKGLISVHWKKTTDALLMTVAIPTGSFGRIVIPRHDSAYTTLYEGDALLFDITQHEKESSRTEHPGVKHYKVLHDGSIELHVLSGLYQLEARV